MEVKPFDLVTFIGYVGAVEQTLDAICTPQPTHTVTFEKLFDATEQEAMLAFLGAARAPLTTRTQRSRTIPIHEAVTNYSELSDFLAESPYHWMAPPVMKREQSQDRLLADQRDLGRSQ